MSDSTPTKPEIDNTTSADDVLPPVEAPSGAFLLQLFLIPMVIVTIIVMVWMLFSWLAHMGNDPHKLVESLKRTNDKRWQDASTLANLLRNQQTDSLKDDSNLAKELADVLEEQLRDPLSEDSESAAEQVNLRMYLCAALGEFRVLDGLPVLMSAAKARPTDKEGDEDVRQFALQAIAALAKNVGPKSLRENKELQELLRNSTAIGGVPDKVRIPATFTLGVIGGQNARDQLAKIVERDRDPNVRFNAATGLARSGDLRAVPTLLRMLDIDDETAMNDMLKGEEKVNHEWKRVSVVVNAIRAAEKLAQQNPPSESESLLTAIQAVADKEGLPRGLRMEADMVVKRWKTGGTQTDES